MKANITRGNSVTDHILSEITDEEKEVFRKFIQERLRPPFEAASVTHSNHFNIIGIEAYANIAAKYTFVKAQEGLNK